MKRLRPPTKIVHYAGLFNEELSLWRQAKSQVGLSDTLMLTFHTVMYLVGFTFYILVSGSVYMWELRFGELGCTFFICYARAVSFIFMRIVRFLFSWPFFFSAFSFLYPHLRWFYYCEVKNYITPTDCGFDKHVLDRVPPGYVFLEYVPSIISFPIKPM